MSSKAQTDNSSKGESKKYLDTIVQREVDLENNYSSTKGLCSEARQIRPIEQTLRRREEDEPSPPDHRAGQPSPHGVCSPVHGSESRREGDRNRQDD